jgi:hypothetical protein
MLTSAPARRAPRRAYDDDLPIEFDDYDPHMSRSRRGGRAMPVVSASAAPAAAKPKKKEPKAESKEEAAYVKSEAFKKLPLVLLSAEHSAVLRTLLGVREGDAPEALYKEALVEELAEKGYPKSLCMFSHR